MDGISAAASILAIVKLTGIVIEYLNDVNDAPKECQQCTIEACNIQNLLVNLRYRLEQGRTGDPWFIAVRTLNLENGPFDQYRRALEQLQSKVEIQDGMKKFKRRLVWKFSREEVQSILARIERLKSLVVVALEMDHFKLSQAIKEDIATMRIAIPILQDNVVMLQKAQSLQWDAQKLQHHQAVLDWLSPSDFGTQQYDIISRRQEGTGQWFLNSAEFKGWLHGHDKTLFCPGIPGAGKTMMAAIAIDRLYQVASSENIGVAYVYCNYKSQSDQGVNALLAAMLKQLVQSRPFIAEPVYQMYNIHCSNRMPLSLDEIFTALQSACTNYSRVHIVVDALDECTNQEGAQSQLLAKLHELQHGSAMHLMVTARFIPDIEEQFRSALKLEVRASDEDISRYITGQMPRLPKCIQNDEDMKRLVQEKLVKAVDGMFLLARLHVESLLDKKTKRKAISTLNNLGKGSAALDEAYSDAIKRIDGQLPEDRKLARLVLSWMIYAQRLLTTQELCHALAVEPGDTELDEDNVPDIEDVISVCAGLVTIDEERKTIRLVHYTTQEYFERTILEWSPRSEQDLASTCLTYLSLAPFRVGSCDTDAEFEERFMKNVFLDYAVRHFAAHIRPVEAAVSDLALAFLRHDGLVSCSTQMISARHYFRISLTGVRDTWAGYSQYFPRASTGLHLSARFGLVYLSRLLLTVDCDNTAIYVNSRDSDGRTPLSWAAQEGHEGVAKLLVETGKADVDSKDNCGWTPLSWAAAGGHEAVVKLLIETGEVDVNSKDKEHGQTALSLAAMEGESGTVQLLIEMGKVDVDLKDNYGETPFKLAARRGREDIVKLLAKTGRVDFNSKDKEGQTPLFGAAIRPHEAVVKLLIEMGNVEVDSKDIYGRTPLSHAAEEGNEAVVKLLLETGKVNIESEDKNGRTPLWVATSQGHEAVVKLLRLGK